MKPVRSPPFRTPPVTPTAARHPDLGRRAPLWAERVHRGLSVRGGTRPAGFCRSTRNNDPHDGGGGGAGGRPADRRPGGCASARAVRSARTGGPAGPGRSRGACRGSEPTAAAAESSAAEAAPSVPSADPDQPSADETPSPAGRRRGPTPPADDVDDPPVLRPDEPSPPPVPPSAAAAPQARRRRRACRRRGASRRSPDGRGRGRRGVGGPHLPAGAPSGTGSRTGAGGSHHRRRRRDARGAAHPGRFAGHRHRGYRPRPDRPPATWSPTSTWCTASRRPP